MSTTVLFYTVESGCKEHMSVECILFVKQIHFCRLISACGPMKSPSKGTLRKKGLMVLQKMDQTCNVKGMSKSKTQLNGITKVLTCAS